MEVGKSIYRINLLMQKESEKARKELIVLITMSIQESQNALI